MNTNIKVYRDKSVAELRKELLDIRKEQFNLRVQKQITNSPPKPSLVRLLRKNIARIKTILQEKGEV